MAVQEYKLGEKASGLVAVDVTCTAENSRLKTATRLRPPGGRLGDARHEVADAFFPENGETDAEIGKQMSDRVSG